MPNIKRLLNKQGWTGRELGLIQIAELVNTYSQALKGNYKATPLVEAGQFSKMLNSISDGVQGQTYNNYLKIHNWLKSRPSIANAHSMSLENNLTQVRETLLRAALAEDVYTYIQKLPAIMTQKQYDELHTKRIEAYLTDNDGNDLLYNIYDFIQLAVSFYLEKLRETPSYDNPLKLIRKKYINEPIENERILSRWNEVTERGYYTVEDGSGRRSDKMTAAEWKAVLAEPDIDRAFSSVSPRIGEYAVSEIIALSYIVDGKKVEFDNIPSPAGEWLNFPLKWHNYENPPETLTKWEVIEAEPVIYDLLFRDNDKEYSEIAKDYYSEFKELVDIMLQDMQKLYFSDDEIKLSDIPPEKWGCLTMPSGRLYSLDFYGMQKLAENDTLTFIGDNVAETDLALYNRALFYGIAILRPSDIANQSPCIDENGYYIEPEVIPSIKQGTLGTFFPESEDYAYSVKYIEYAYKGIAENYYYLKGYNAQIDLIIELTGLKELEIFKADLEVMNRRLDNLNELVEALYREIKDTSYSDKVMQAKKLKVLREIFQPVDYNALTIPAGKIEQAKQLISDFSAFSKAASDFDELLCYRRNSGEGAC